MRRLLLLIVFCITGCATTAEDDAAVAEDANRAIASGVTGSDIWLGELNRGSGWSIDNLKNVTTRQGYDNQPAFTANGTGVYYSSIRDGTQSDVYLFERSVGAGFRFASTPQSEFSPLPIPAAKGISVVRVEADGKQQLWRYASGEPTLLHANIDNLGYYTWLDRETVAMFLVTEPPTLALATVPDGRIELIDAEPGRSLAAIPGTGVLSFLDKSDNDAWWISAYDRATGVTRRIAPALQGSEDFCWTPDGELLMAQARKIYVWRQQWEIAVDLGGRIPGDITRLQVDPHGSQIAFAAAEGTT